MIDPDPDEYDFIDVPVVDGVVTLPDGYTIRTTTTAPTVRVAVPKIWANLAAVGRRASGGWDTDSLDAAWAEAEAALPEGWLLVELRLHDDRSAWGAEAFNETGDGPYRQMGYGSTPAAALRALAAKLRNRQEG